MTCKPTVKVYYYLSDWLKNNCFVSMCRVMVFNEFESRPWRGEIDTTLCDKVCQ